MPMPLTNPARLTMTKSQRYAWLRENRFINQPHISSEIERAFWRREMEMDCPDCALRQPAGNACWRCACPTFVPDWFNRRARRRSELTPADIARDKVNAARLRSNRPRRARKPRAS